MDVGAPELIIILVIVLLLFGPGRLGNLGHEMGRAVHELRKGLSGDEGEDKPPSQGPVVDVQPATAPQPEPQVQVASAPSDPHQTAA